VAFSSCRPAWTPGSLRYSGRSDAALPRAPCVTVMARLAQRFRVCPCQCSCSGGRSASHHSALRSYSFKFKFLAIARSCRNCRGSAQVVPKDPYHAFFECTQWHGKFPALRIQLINSVRDMWLKLFTSLQRAVSLSHRGGSSCWPGPSKIMTY
jgi:hypothetical protein